MLLCRVLWRRCVCVSRVGVCVCWGESVVCNVCVCVCVLSGLYQGTLTEGKGSVQLTSMYQLVQIGPLFKLKILLSIYNKQEALIRRSTLLGLSPQLVFPTCTIKYFHNHDCK
jgi:hypothetical protein